MYVCMYVCVFMHAHIHTYMWPDMAICIAIYGLMWSYIYASEAVTVKTARFWTKQEKSISSITFPASKASNKIIFVDFLSVPTVQRTRSTEGPALLPFLKRCVLFFSIFQVLSSNKFSQGNVSDVVFPKVCLVIPCRLFFSPVPL